MKISLMCTLSLVLVFDAVPSAEADTAKRLSVEFETLITKEDSFQPGVAVLTAITAKDGALGGFVFSWAGETYAEAYGGFTLTFPVGRGHLWTAYGIGIEQSDAPDDHSPLRFGGMAILDLPRHLVCARTEIGATQKKFAEPYWYVRYAWKPNEQFDLGIMAREFAGIGPRIDFWLHRPGLGVWAAPLYDPDTASWRAMLTFTTGY